MISNVRRVPVSAAGLLLALLLWPAPALAQVEPCPAPTKEVAGVLQPNLPPEGSPTLYRCAQFIFHPENVPVVEYATYLYYLKTAWSKPSEDKWVPWNADAILADFKSLWATGFLDNLWIEEYDEPYANGVGGKKVVFHFEERRRVKIVDYNKGSKRIDTATIEEKLKEAGIVVRLDSFIDDSIVRRVMGIVRELYAEKGYQYAEVTPEIRSIAGGPKLVHLSFIVTEGPKVKIRDVAFDGNTAFSDGKLEKQMKDNRAKGKLSFVTGTGTYQAARFEDDADKLREYYREQGYVLARIGQQQLEIMEDSKDGTTRWVRLRIPVDEGNRYRIGKFEIAGATSVKPEALRAVFKVEEGDFYSQKRIRKGIELSQELYGRGGFMDFTAYPEPNPNDVDMETGAKKPDVTGPPTVDVVIRVEEGSQFVVNRLTFFGNTTTRDSVIRREMRLYEGSVFDTESLKYSLRRLNQLGYFKPLEGGNDSVKVEKTPGVDGKVDVSLRFEEQNRNQLSFGAGVSQFEGFFGQLSFQTSNFLGRGETLSVSAQKGSQAKNYQIAFTEPFLFDRPITAGLDIHTRQVIYPFQFTQDSTGGNILVGLPVADWARAYIGYSYEQVAVKDIDPVYLLPEVLESNVLLRESLLVDQGGKRTVSKISPSIAYSTINEPIFPSRGTKYTAGFDFAGLGGDTTFWQTRGEAIWYLPLTTRTNFGIRVSGEFVKPYGNTKTLPIFEKLFLGGEYSVRGFDLRSIGHRDPNSGLVLGGDKTLLFNIEYVVNVGGPVRVLAFYDAGQVQSGGQRYAMDQFKTSTGGEIRFFMPVLNVPFRLIFAYNPQRSGIFDNNLRPQKKFLFRFAVGTTF